MLLFVNVPRFTSYDFKQMQRRSYYPQNQQIISTITAGSSSGVVSSRPGTPTTIPGDAVHTDSTNGSAYGHKPLHEPHEMMMDSRAVAMNDMTSEKGVAC